MLRCLERRLTVAHTVLCGKSRKLAIGFKTARAGSMSDIAILQQAVNQPRTVGDVNVREVRRVSCSIHVALTDKGAQSTQVNPSRSDGPGVPASPLEHF